MKKASAHLASHSQAELYARGVKTNCLSAVSLRGDTTTGYKNGWSGVTLPPQLPAAGRLTLLANHCLRGESVSKMEEEGSSSPSSLSDRFSGEGMAPFQCPVHLRPSFSTSERLKRTSQHQSKSVSSVFAALERAYLRFRLSYVIKWPLQTNRQAAGLKLLHHGTGPSDFSFWPPTWKNRQPPESIFLPLSLELDEAWNFTLSPGWCLLHPSHQATMSIHSHW